MSLEKLENIKKKIQNSSVEEQIEIFNLFKANNVKYTQNKNGIFIILNNIDDTIIEKISNFLLFLNDTNKKTKEIEDKMIILNKFKN